MYVVVQVLNFFFSTIHILWHFEDIIIFLIIFTNNYLGGEKYHNFLIMDHHHKVLEASIIATL